MRYNCQSQEHHFPLAFISHNIHYHIIIIVKDSSKLFSKCCPPTTSLAFIVVMFSAGLLYFWLD